VNSTTLNQKKPRLRDRTAFSRLVRHPARKPSGSILTSYNPEPARGRGGGILCMICSCYHHSRCVCCVRNGTVIRDARTVSFNDNSTRAALRCVDIAARRKRFYVWWLYCI